MSVVIVSGNERMERQYKSIRREYRCRAKVLTKMTGTFQNKIGKPDLLVLFNNTTSHKMVCSALNEIKGLDTKIVRSHLSSGTALKEILKEHTEGGTLCLSR